MKVPVYSIDLIKELEKIYPNKFPSHIKSQEEFYTTKGQVELVQMLVNSITKDQELKDK